MTFDEKRQRLATWQVTVNVHSPGYYEYFTRIPIEIQMDVINSHDKAFQRIKNYEAQYPDVTIDDILNPNKEIPEDGNVWAEWVNSGKNGYVHRP